MDDGEVRLDLLDELLGCIKGENLGCAICEKSVGHGATGQGPDAIIWRDDDVRVAEDQGFVRGDGYYGGGGDYAANRGDFCGRVENAGGPIDCWLDNVTFGVRSLIPLVTGSR
jgi:hypothetical protein